MHKKILLILGHPDKNTFNGALAEAYETAALAAGAEVRRLNLGELKFDPVLWLGYKKIQTLEPHLLQAQKDIQWAEHLVIIYPTWWSTMPALFKGFFDRLLLPGFAFNFRARSPFWDKRLTGKSARLIVTMDGPALFYKIYLGNPGHKIMKYGILKFCGIKPVKITSLYSVKNRSDRTKRKWLKKISKLGAKTV
ncbi:MAG: NADPH:quinone reductase [Candidatus Komeilibacteria bacterium RIFOXYC2_FULL_45_12]|nr:MAG: NADPH:quinone reductase [Candidatus Komeilibacteria bacterium RIFOXYC2_FULL_45_12]